MRIAPHLFLGSVVLVAGCTLRGEVLTPVSELPDAGGLAGARDISVGERHGCLVMDGALHCWGSNDLGQLGTGDNDSRLFADRVAVGQAFVQVAVGAVHSCALDDLGVVYCWGGNDRGQLGQGDRTARSVPTLVPLPARATSVATKYRHSCALLATAALYCWGQNSEGELGQADTPPPNDEAAKDGLSPLPVADADWRTIDSGDGHTCGVSLDGSLWCWGRNSEHELGSEPRIQVREPIRVTSDGPWLTVSAGQNYTCGVRDDRTLWCWGQNTGSSSGDGYPLGIAGSSELDAPGRVGLASDWTAVRTNVFHSCAINRSAELWCWGRNIEGQLGTGDLAARETPILVGRGYAKVSVGRFATCAFATDGEPRCTGMNENGQLGTGDLERRNQLTPVALNHP